MSMSSYFVASTTPCFTILAQVTRPHLQQYVERTLAGRAAVRQCASVRAATTLSEQLASGGALVIECDSLKNPDLVSDIAAQRRRFP